MLRNPHRNRNITRRDYTVPKQEVLARAPKIHEFCLYAQPDYRIKDDLVAAGAKDVHVGHDDDGDLVLTFFRFAPNLLEAVQSALGQLAKTHAKFTGIFAFQEIEKPATEDSEAEDADNG